VLNPVTIKTERINGRTRAAIECPRLAQPTFTAHDNYNSKKESTPDGGGNSTSAKKYKHVGYNKAALALKLGAMTLKSPV